MSATNGDFHTRNFRPLTAKEFDEKCNNFFDISKKWNGKSITDKIHATGTVLLCMTVVVPVVIKIMQEINKRSGDIKSDRPLTPNRVSATHSNQTNSLSTSEEGLSSSDLLSPTQIKTNLLKREINNLKQFYPEIGNLLKQKLGEGTHSLELVEQTLDQIVLLHLNELSKMGGDHQEFIDAIKANLGGATNLEKNMKAIFNYNVVHLQLEELSKMGNHKEFIDSIKTNLKSGKITLEQSNEFIYDYSRRNNIKIDIINKMPRPSFPQESVNANANYLPSMTQSQQTGMSELNAGFITQTSKEELLRQIGNISRVYPDILKNLNEHPEVKKYLNEHRDASSESNRESFEKAPPEIIEKALNEYTQHRMTSMAEWHGKSYWDAMNAKYPTKQATYEQWLLATHEFWET